MSTIALQTDFSGFVTVVDYPDRIRCLTDVTRCFGSGTTISANGGKLTGPGLQAMGLSDPGAAAPVRRTPLSNHYFIL
jgi:hypothetical protein